MSGAGRYRGWDVLTAADTGRPAAARSATGGGGIETGDGAGWDAPSPTGPA